MAGTPQSLTMKLYQAVIADVINNVKEAFQEEGVDEQVLQELKHIWEAKLVSSKALESVETETETHKLPDQKTVQVYQQPRQQTQQQQPQQSQPPIQQQQQPVKHQQAVSQHQQVPPPPQQQQAPSSNMNSLAQDLNKKIPIQITLPAQHGSTNREGRVVTIQVPASTLQGNQLQSVLGGSVITAAMSVPTDVATVLLQQHVDNVVLLQQQQAQQQQLQQQQQQLDTKPVFPQYDGAHDTSDDDDDDDDDDKDDDDEDDDDDDQDIDDDDDENEENEGIEDEPLNSSDDVSEEDPALFDTDNIVVCQYDKITRSRNKWKFYLKDGIMNLNGKDFVFLKANGDADW
ncbi:hypothetical protein M8J77_002219 [Diaphorina citri]|nr:hypothetical protein M8J77_002219 [Diaphorina citri]